MAFYSNLLHATFSRVVRGNLGNLGNKPAQALDRRREILSLPLPDDDDDSLEATKLRALVLTAADSTIGQTIALRSTALEKAADDNAVEQFIEERRQKALLQIAKMRE